MVKVELERLPMGLVVLPEILALLSIQLALESVKPVVLNSLITRLLVMVSTWWITLLVTAVPAVAVVTLSELVEALVTLKLNVPTLPIEVLAI